MLLFNYLLYNLQSTHSIQKRKTMKNNRDRRQQLFVCCLSLSLSRLLTVDIFGGEEDQILFEFLCFLTWLTTECSSGKCTTKNYLLFI